MLEAKTVTLIAQRAAELVAEIQSEFRPEAFQVVFGALLDEQLGEPTKPGKSPELRTPVVSEGAGSGAVGRILASPLDYSLYARSLDTGSWVDKVLVVIGVAEDTLGIDGLTPPEVSKVMTSQLRIPAVYASNLSREMGGARKLLARTKEGRVYRYRLTRAGRERLKALEEQGA